MNKPNFLKTPFNEYLENIKYSLSRSNELIYSKEVRENLKELNSYLIYQIQNPSFSSDLTDLTQVRDELVLADAFLDSFIKEDHILDPVDQWKYTSIDEMLKTVSNVLKSVLIEKNGVVRIIKNGSLSGFKSNFYCILSPKNMNFLLKSKLILPMGSSQVFAPVSNFEEIFVKYKKDAIKVKIESL